MTQAAAAYLASVGRRYLAASGASAQHWLFDEGREQSEHVELELLGLIEKMLGTSRGFAWRLTATGLAVAVAPSAAAG